MTDSAQIGNFRIIERIGEGGMGEVFHALDPMLEREVALKTLRAELSANTELVERFRVEAIALAKLNHPNIAAIYSFFRENDHYHIAMQYVLGPTLESVLKKRTRLSWQEAAQIGIDVLQALEHAHAQGVIHRDIKPANLKLDPAGHAVVMDFGIARVLSHARQTRSGNMVGTLEYIAPEIVRGENPTPLVDFYSLGVVLFEMVTGRLPFVAETDYALMRAHIEQAPPLPAALCSELPAEFSAVILRAMAKDPGERFANARDFILALADAANITAPGTSVSHPLLQAHREGVRFSTRISLKGWLVWIGSNPGLTLAAVAGIVALGFIATRHIDTPEPQRSAPRVSIDTSAPPPTPASSPAVGSRLTAETHSSDSVPAIPKESYSEASVAARSEREIVQIPPAPGPKPTVSIGKSSRKNTELASGRQSESNRRQREPANPSPASRRYEPAEPPKPKSAEASKESSNAWHVRE